MKIDELAIALRAVLDEMDNVNGVLKELRVKKDVLLIEIQRSMEEVGIDSAKSNEAGLALTLKEDLVADYQPELFDKIFKFRFLASAHGFWRMILRLFENLPLESLRNK